MITVCMDINIKYLKTAKLEKNLPTFHGTNLKGDHTGIIDNRMVTRAWRKEKEKEEKRRIASLRVPAT